MPKTKLDKAFKDSVESLEIMDDFQVPDELRKQLEYPSSVKKRQLALEHIDRKLTDRLVQLNIRLKEDKVKVSIQRQGDSLVLQATLPLKPNEVVRDEKLNKQTKISLGIPFNADGLKTAEEEARELGRLIARKMFTWNEKYFRVKTLNNEAAKTISELMEDFENKYFLIRKKNRQSLHTFGHHKGNILNYVSMDKLLNDETIINAIQKTKAGSAARQGIVSALSVFCNSLNYQYSFKGYKNGYVPKKRVLPTDEQIEKEIFKLVGIRSTFQGDQWRWVYGMLATYGLRPHEVYAVDVEKFITLSNTLHALTLDESLTEGLKTGSRVIFPLYPEWVELFDLKNVRIPKLLKVPKDAKIEYRSRTISLIFRRKGISFAPYDLRHAYAIRGHIMGVPLKEMADNMGHSVDMHTKTYQKYITIDNRRMVYEKVINKTQNIKVERTEIEQLRSENEALRALLTKRQLDEVLN